MLFQSYVNFYLFIRSSGFLFIRSSGFGLLDQLQIYPTCFVKGLSAFHNLSKYLTSHSISLHASAAHHPTHSSIYCTPMFFLAKEVCHHIYYVWDVAATTAFLAAKAEEWDSPPHIQKPYLLCYVQPKLSKMLQWAVTPHT